MAITAALRGAICCTITKLASLLRVSDNEMAADDQVDVWVAILEKHMPTDAPSRLSAFLPCLRQGIQSVRTRKRKRLGWKNTKDLGDGVESNGDIFMKINVLSAILKAQCLSRTRFTLTEPVNWRRNFHPKRHLTFILQASRLGKLLILDV
jgi:hypothetical protein